MTPSTYDLEERAKYLTEARETSFLSAIFLLTYYNESVLFYRVQPTPAKINPLEVFESLDSVELQSAIARSKALLHDTGYVGEAFFNYSGAMPYEKAVERMKREHAGFSDRCYEIAIAQNARAMR